LFMNILYKNILFILFCVYSSVSFASDAGYNDTTSQVAPLNNPDFTGNVGIGSATPGQVLDVQGTIRSTNLTVTALGPITTECLQANSSGVFSVAGAACSPSTNYWSLTGGTGNVGISNNNTVGIGTTSGIGAGLVVMNGNVGIGTWSPADYFQVGKFSSSSGGFEVDTNGNVGIGTNKTTSGGLRILNGNIGIGTWIANSSVSITPSDGVTFIQAQGNSVSWSITDNGSGYAFLNITTGNGVIFDSTNNQVMSFGNAVGTSNQVEVSANGGAYEGMMGVNGIADGNIYLENVAGGNNSVDIGNGNGTWENLQMLSAVVGSTYATQEYTPPTSGLLVQGDVGIGTYNINTGLDIVGNVGIGSTTTSLYVTIAPPAGGMLVNGNVGIGTWVPGGKLIIKGANVGIGSVAPGATLVVNSAAAHSGTGVCWGTSGCIGYCTAGTWPNCTTCNCL
jgi:hypothetical protein